MEGWELIRGGRSLIHGATAAQIFVVTWFNVILLATFFPVQKLYFCPIRECSQVTWGVYMQGWWITCRKPCSQSRHAQCSLCVPHRHQSGTTRQPYGGMQYNGLSQICPVYELWGAFPHLAASGKMNYNYKLVNLRSKGNI